MGESRRPVDVEKLLHWAFRDELPKRSIEGTWGYEMSPMFNLVALGTRVDASSSEPGFPAILGGCHPDAHAVSAAVSDLGDFELDWPRTRPVVMGDLAALLRDDDPTLASLTINRVGLVGMHARMGTRPPWQGIPLPEPIIGNNGKPVVEFVNEKGLLERGRRGRHYGPMPRSPLMWFPDPRDVAFGRIEYSVWHGALVQLAGMLQLSERIALPPAAAAKPWVAETLNHRAEELALAD